jgi:hypothetical protein
MKKPKTETMTATCGTIVWHNRWNYIACGKPIVATRDGIGYCGVHDPGGDEQTWWEVRTYYDEPRAVRVTKVGLAVVTVNGRRSPIKSESGSFHRTKVEALEEMAAKWRGKVKDAERQMLQAEKRLHEITAMIKREETP